MVFRLKLDPKRTVCQKKHENRRVIVLFHKLFIVKVMIDTVSGQKADFKISPLYLVRINLLISNGSYLVFIGLELKLCRDIIETYHF